MKNKNITFAAFLKHQILSSFLSPVFIISAFVFVFYVSFGSEAKILQGFQMLTVDYPCDRICLRTRVRQLNIPKTRPGAGAHPTAQSAACRYKLSQRHDPRLPTLTLQAGS